MPKNTKDELKRTISMVLIFVVFILLNNIFLLKKIERERIDRISELQQQMKNLQTRINLNTSEIKSTGN